MYRWYSERATMQAFGRAPELQAAKVQEVAARSAVLGKVMQKMLTRDPRQRISSAELANELQPGGTELKEAVRDQEEKHSLLKDKSLTGLHIRSRLGLHKYNST